MIVNNCFTVIFLHQRVQIRIINNSTQTHKNICHQIFISDGVDQNLYDLVIQINGILLSELNTPAFEIFTISTISTVHSKEFYINSWNLNMIFCEVLDGSL